MHRVDDLHLQPAARARAGGGEQRLRPELRNAVATSARLGAEGEKVVAARVEPDDVVVSALRHRARDRQQADDSEREQRCHRRRSTARAPVTLLRRAVSRRHASILALHGREARVRAARKTFGR